eukprot:2245214-Alexandrium_andersonii.AAC.1
MSTSIDLDWQTLALDVLNIQPRKEGAMMDRCRQTIVIDHEFEAGSGSHSAERLAFRQFRLSRN